MYRYCDKCGKETEHRLYSPKEGASSHKSGAMMSGLEFVEMIKASAEGKHFEPPKGVTSYWKCTVCGAKTSVVQRVDGTPNPNPVHLRDLR